MPKNKDKTWKKTEFEKKTLQTRLVEDGYYWMLPFASYETYEGMPEKIETLTRKTVNSLVDGGQTLTKSEEETLKEFWTNKWRKSRSWDEFVLTEQQIKDLDPETKENYERNIKSMSTKISKENSDKLKFLEYNINRKDVQPKTKQALVAITKRNDPEVYRQFIETHKDYKDKDLSGSLKTFEGQNDESPELESFVYRHLDDDGKKMYENTHKSKKADSSTDTRGNKRPRTQISPETATSSSKPPETATSSSKPPETATSSSKPPERLIPEETDGNAYNDFLREGADPMQASSQPYQRMSATGGAGFKPLISFQEETRDEGDRSATQSLVPVLQTGGDTTTANQPAEATLRAGYQLDPLANKVVPAPEKQIQSDVLFDMFSVVQPGFGKGADNKLVYENEARENAVRFQEPLFTPRFEHGGADIGIAQHVHPLRWQFQPNGVGAQIAAHVQSLEQRISNMNDLLIKATSVGRDVQTLPDVSNYTPSSQGLPRQQTNLLNPVIDNRARWNPVVEAPGYALNQRGMRHTHSPWSRPFNSEYDPMNSGPVLKKRRSLEVILP